MSQQEESYIFYYKCQSENKLNTYEYRACEELKTRKRFYRFYWLTLETGWAFAQTGVNQDLGNVDGIPQSQIEHTNLLHVITHNYDFKENN